MLNGVIPLFRLEVNNTVNKVKHVSHLRATGPECPVLDKTVKPDQHREDKTVRNVQHRENKVYKTGLFSRRNDTFQPFLNLFSRTVLHGS